MDNLDKLNFLQNQLNDLSKRQNHFYKDILRFKQEINRLKQSLQSESTPETEQKFEKKVISEVSAPSKPVISSSLKKSKSTALKPKSNWEKFIGENLMNKIGILVTIIGVGIGAKYSIENNLINPLTRIILGYLVGICLLGFGIKLKKNFTNYSAVLVSGAMAILYFITFCAYSFYALIPQAFAFVLMVVFTGFTVLASIHYKTQIIALIGLVGAYAVPYLLSDGTGKVEILFSYVAIINIGILVLSFKKYWKILYYSSFSLTWLIYSSWYVFSYGEKHFTLAFIFLGIFFVTFYTTFLAYKAIRKEKFTPSDVVIIILNSFLFYGFGYLALEGHEVGVELLGLFTLLNAVIHFTVSTMIYRMKLVDKKIIYLLATLVLVFITIAIPVQLNGNWVTLLWIAEATILFWIARTRKINFHEVLSYIALFLAMLSLLEDWVTIYDNYSETIQSYRKPVVAFLNIHFLTGLLFTLGLGTILWVHLKTNSKKSNLNKEEFYRLFTYSVSGILLTVLYITFRMEIVNYWTGLYANSYIDIVIEEFWNKSLLNLRTIWIVNFSLLFVSALAVLNLTKIKSKQLMYISLGLCAIAILTFLTQGDLTLNELKESYLYPSEYYNAGIFYILIRYISLTFFMITLTTMHVQRKQTQYKEVLNQGLEIFIYGTLIWLSSNELVYWMSFKKMDFIYYEELISYSLSILWGVSSLALITFGIFKNRKHIRISAMVLFGVTLIKLFFFDLSHLSTIPKTIVFVCLGGLLLIISYLYQKYKNKISYENNK